MKKIVFFISLFLCHQAFADQQTISINTAGTFLDCQVYVSHIGGDQPPEVPEQTSGIIRIEDETSYSIEIKCVNSLDIESDGKIDLKEVVRTLQITAGGE
jgi:hypothetical protein